VRRQRFELGQLVATPGALEVLGQLEVSPSELLERPGSGDWGDVPAEDARENELSVREGFRIVSSYPHLPALYPPNLVERNSANFAVHEFCELRLNGVLRSPHVVPSPSPLP
jgi:hypothetical protein